MGQLSILLPTSTAALYATISLFLITTLLCITRFHTNWIYNRHLSNFLPQRSKPSKPQTLSPLQIPYTLPWLGNTLSFLTTKPGSYWTDLFAWHARSTGACSLLIAGRTTHILYSPIAIQAMFKDRTMKRDRFEVEMFGKVLAMEHQQIENAQKGKWMEHEMNSKFLMKFDRVNELTAKFCEVLNRVTREDEDDIDSSGATGQPRALYAWMKDKMFTASAIALMGSKLLELYPDYQSDFWQFDRNFLSYFFGLPHFMMKDAIKRRDKIISNLMAWSKEMHAQSGGTPIDPEGGPAWEPLFGSRLNRARQIDYKNRNLNAYTSAALDLGLTFGLASNVIPITGWMLINVLNPQSDPTLLPRVMDEIRRAEKKNDGTGELDIPTLVSSPLLQSIVSSPLLQSIWTETLRLYTDILVTRGVTHDTTLPLDEDGKTCIQLKKGDDVYAPSWLGHHDAESWTSVDDFHADRYLISTDPSKPDEKTFVPPKGNNLFPFGGGVTICPGRFFAKQEALGAFAMILLKFELDVVGFVDKDGKETDASPGFASSLPGSGGLVPAGDVMVRMRRRERG